MIDTKMLKSFREDFAKTVGELEEKYNLKISLGHISYSSDEFTGKITAVSTVGKDGKAVDTGKTQFEKHGKYFGLKAENYMQEVRVHGSETVYILCGIKPNARKNAAIIKDKKTGRQYVCAPRDLDSLDGKPLREDAHRCKYCGGLADGPDEDVLCYECRSLFGHALYSEL